MNLQVIIPILAGLSVMLIGGGVLLGYSSRRAPLRARLEGAASGSSVADAITRPSSPRLAGLIGNLGTFVSSGRTSRGLAEELVQAGYDHGDAAAIYLGVKVLLFSIGLSTALVALVGSNTSQNRRFAIAGSLAMICFMAPNVVVASRRSHRRREISRHLPEAIDLLEICASSGMGLDMAWNCVADEIREVSDVLADEMALTNLEIHLGATRADAMRHMARRTGADELSSLVAVLVQSERFGTSVSEALQVFAAYMRETSSQRAQEKAEKMAVKLIFPMVGMIFPAIVILMAGPAFLALYRSLHMR